MTGSRTHWAHPFLKDEYTVLGETSAPAFAKELARKMTNPLLRTSAASIMELLQQHKGYRWLGHRERQDTPDKRRKVLQLLMQPRQQWDLPPMAMTPMIKSKSSMATTLFRGSATDATVQKIAPVLQLE
jgi:hypothetical protein